MFSFIWMQITAPMKNEISSTIPMESTPNACISVTYFFQNMRNRSGRENVLPISRIYLPRAKSHLYTNVCFMNTFVTFR